MPKYGTVSQVLLQLVVASFRTVIIENLCSESQNGISEDLRY